MSTTSIFASGQTTVNNGLNTLAFAVLTFIIIFGWILVSALLRLVENIAFSTLGMNPRSTASSLILFLVLFFLFITIVWFVDALQIIPAAQGGNSLADATSGFVQNQPTTNNVVGTLGSGRLGAPIVIAPGGY